MRKLQRHAYEGKELGLRELRMFGWASTPRAADLGLRRHVHKNAYEICLIDSGSVQWWVGHEIYQLNRGDIYITRPDEPHGGIDEVMHPCTLYWLILPVPAKSKSLPALTARQTRMLFTEFKQMTQRTFASSVLLQSHFKQMHVELQDHSDFQPAGRRAVLHQLLIQLLRDHAQAIEHPQHRQRSKAVAKAMQWMSEHLDEDQSIEDIASQVDLGVSRFHERFLAEVGLTPADYRTHLRVRQAQQLLRNTEQTITQISFDLGFSSSQYFATVFKKIVGMTPGQYRQTQPLPWQ